MCPSERLCRRRHSFHCWRSYFNFEVILPWLARHPLVNFGLRACLSPSPLSPLTPTTANVVSAADIAKGIITSIWEQLKALVKQIMSESQNKGAP